MCSKPVIWERSPECELVWKSWDDEHVVFERRSGDIHFLDAITGALLLSLEQGPRTAEELSGVVAAVLAPHFEADLRGPVAAGLVRLHELELIRPVGTVDGSGAFPGGSG